MQLTIFEPDSETREFSKICREWSKSLFASNSLAIIEIICKHIKFLVKISSLQNSLHTKCDLQNLTIPNTFDKS